MPCRSRARRGHLLHPQARRCPLRLRQTPTRNSPRSHGPMSQHFGRVNRKRAVRLKPRKPSRSFRKRCEGQTRLRRHRRHPNRLRHLQDPRRRPRRGLKCNGPSRHLGPHHRRARPRRWQGQRHRRPEWPRRRPLDRPRRHRDRRPRWPVRRRPRRDQLRLRHARRRRRRPRNARRMFQDAESETGHTSI